MTHQIDNALLLHGGEDDISIPGAALQQIIGTDDFTAVYGSLTRENKRRFWRSILRNITFVDTPATRGRAEIPFIVEFL